MSSIERKFRDNYVLSRTLGDGNFSLVRKCRHKFSRNMYAAKIVKLPSKTITTRGLKHDTNTSPMTAFLKNNKIDGVEEIDIDDLSDDEENKLNTYEDILDMIRNEVGLMRKLKHQNIVQFVDVFFSDMEVIVVTELTEHGDLQAFLLKEKLQEDTARLYCSQIASAINYMHTYKIIHRDIKPENILMFKSKTDEVYTMKLCDFGLAEEISTMCGLKRVCGSPSFIAPEILEFKSYGLAVDIWSMGILFYLMLCNYVPFDDEELSEKFDMIIHSELVFPPTDWSSISTDAKGLIKRMLNKNPKNRPKASDVMYSRWFKKPDSVNWRSTITKRISEVSQKTFKSAAIAVSTMRMFANNQQKKSRDNAIISRKLVENTFLLSKSARLKSLLLPDRIVTQNENIAIRNISLGINPLATTKQPQAEVEQINTRNNDFLSSKHTKDTHHMCNKIQQETIKTATLTTKPTQAGDVDDNTGGRYQQYNPRNNAVLPKQTIEYNVNQSNIQQNSKYDVKYNDNYFKNTPPPILRTRLSSSTVSNTPSPPSIRTINTLPPISTSNSILRASSDESMNYNKTLSKSLITSI